MQTEITYQNQVDPITDKLFIGQRVRYNAKHIGEVVKWDNTHVLLRFDFGGEIGVSHLATPIINYLKYK
jgi:hypothetical protein